MQYETSWEDSFQTRLHLKLDGKLLFGQFQELQAFIFDLKEKPPAHITFDLSDVEIIDSSGLGLLVVANELTGENKNVTLKCPNEQVEHLFQVCKFDELMNIVRG